MASELAFILINPYTISKSRTGGIIGRVTARTGLELVGARMFGPSAELVRRYAELIRSVDDVPSADERELLASYVAQAYAPDPKTGRRRRVMLLLFEGENAVLKIKTAVGLLRPNAESGESVRDTFGDYVLDEKGAVRYVEPAVMIGRSAATIARVLKLWSEFSEKDGGLIEDAADVAKGEHVHKTLVMLKPDNFRFPSSRPGNIVDIFSASGLRIVCAQVHRMTVAEAEEFYGPVREVLRNKLKGVAADRAAKAFAGEFNFTMPEAVQKQIGDLLGPLMGDQQFNQIVKFMTGWDPAEVATEERGRAGRERCLVLVYSGAQAVEKIRKILGPTDPSKAEPGSVRKEYGQNIMVNAAHASDAPESAQREMGILKPQQDVLRPLIEAYYP